MSSRVSSQWRAAPPRPRFAASLPVLALQLWSIVVLLFQEHLYGFRICPAVIRGSDRPGMGLRSGGTVGSRGFHTLLGAGLVPVTYFPLNYPQTACGSEHPSPGAGGTLGAVGIWVPGEVGLSIQGGAGGALGPAIAKLFSKAGGGKKSAKQGVCWHLPGTQTVPLDEKSCAEDDATPREQTVPRGVLSPV